MMKKTRNWLLVLFILALPFVVFLGCLIFMTAAPLPPIPPLPNPNGYDDLVKAGQMMAYNSPDYSGMDPQQLEGLVATNAAALQVYRAGLSNSCRVPLAFSQTYMSNHLNQLATLKRLAQGLAAEGRLAEMAGHPNDAAKSYLDAIRLGNEAARGGVMIDQLVGTASEAIGSAGLQNIAGQLDASTCRQTAAALENLDSHRQSWSEVMQQENDWSHRTFPGLKNEFVRLMTRKMLDAAEHTGEAKFQKQELKERQLIIFLAGRAYQLDKDKSLENVADLVPDYLKAVPRDPVTGKTLD